MPTISAQEYQNLKESQDQLERLKREKEAEPFLTYFVKNLGVLASSTPWKDWPENHKQLLNMAFYQANPTLREEYIARLPK